MAFAIIPISADPNGTQENWLTMRQADEMVCELFGEPVHPKHYCHNWFDNFFYFDWQNVKGRYNFEREYAFSFSTADEAVLHYFKCSLVTWKDTPLWDEVENTKRYVQKEIEPIIRMFYDKGYKIVSLNIG